MALTQHVTSAIVKAALGAAMDEWSQLIAHANINKWSRYKPVRGSWPAGMSGKYGFNLPTNWDYLKPRGGGSNGEPTRAGDFRGYEHDKDIAGPVVWCQTYSVPATLNPGSGADYSASWTFKMNALTESVRIIASDLGLDNYYWGIKILTPGSATPWYKTYGSVLSDNITLDLSVLLDDPAVPSFVDCPYGKGEFTWTLILCSNNYAAWIQATPTTVIELPSGTYGSKTIVSSGTFTVLDWSALSDGNHGWTYSQNGAGVYHSSVVYTSCAPYTVENAISAWLAYVIYDGASDITSTPANWINGTSIRVYPTSANGGSTARSGKVYITDSSNNRLTSLTLSQSYNPENKLTKIIRVKTGDGWLKKPGATITASVGSHNVSGTFTPYDLDPDGRDVYYQILVNGVQKATDIVDPGGCFNETLYSIAETLVDHIIENDTIIIELSVTAF